MYEIIGLFNCSLIAQPMCVESANEQACFLMLNEWSVTVTSVEQ